MIDLYDEGMINLKYKKMDFKDYIIASMIIACGFICRRQTVLLRKVSLFGNKNSWKSQ